MKGGDKYKSKFGGIITILSRIGVMCYFLVLLTNVVKRESASISSSWQRLNFFVDKIEYKTQQDNFDMAVIF
jgi:hypothetical protein